MVKLYKDASCTTELTNYADLFPAARLSPFSKTPVNDSITLYAKKEGSETHEHFGLLDSEHCLEASVGAQKSFSSTFTRVDSRNYNCEDVSKFAIGDFVSQDGRNIAQIIAISGNKITLDANIGSSDSSSDSSTLSVARLLPLGDTTNAVEIIINRNIPYEKAASVGSYYSFNLNTFWEE